MEVFRPWEQCPQHIFLADFFLWSFLEKGILFAFFFFSIFLGEFKIEGFQSTNLCWCRNSPMLCPDIYSPGNSKTSQRHGKGNKGFEPLDPQKRSWMIFDTLWCSNPFCKWFWNGLWVPKHLLTVYLEQKGPKTLVTNPMVSQFWERNIFLSDWCDGLTSHERRYLARRLVNDISTLVEVKNNPPSTRISYKCFPFFLPQISIMLLL